MPVINEIYEPAEDSELLLGCVRGRRGGRALDMGCGSGIIAEELARGFGEVVAADINPKAVEAAARKCPKKVECVASDLFSKVMGKFDLIVFNAPYLPGNEDARWSCKRGGVIRRFFRQAGARLRTGGKIVVCLSSLTPVSAGEIERMGYAVRVVAEKGLFFERLYVLEAAVAENSDDEGD